MGIPHTEVDVVLVNGNSVAFSYQLQHGDSISVYPVFSNIASHEDTIHLACHPVLPVTFVLDVHLGSLARRLRLFGFDCLYRNDYDDSEILQVSKETGRIILTRDLGILKHRQVNNGYLVRSDQVDIQVQEVLTRFRLCDYVKPFSRCMKCNGLMEEVDKARIVDRLEHRTRLYYDEFHRCKDCDRIYWRGPHFTKICKWLEILTSKA